jgi:hypothetical protein
LVEPTANRSESPPLWRSRSSPYCMAKPGYGSCSVAASIIYTWIYNGTGGSLLMVVLFHAASNLFLTVFLVDPFEDQITRPFLIYVALMILAALVVVAATGPATLSRTRAKQVAVP